MANNDTIGSVVVDVAGHDVLPLIEVLKGKKNVSEFTIAEELKEEINTIRNKLYRLYDSNLVEFIRKKDKKKGWYIYYWTFVPSRIPFLLRNIKKKRIEKLKERLKSEQGGNFFVCSEKCVRVGFERAVDFEFKCPECGKLMNQEDNAQRIAHITKEIEVLEKDMLNITEVSVEEERVDVDEITKQKVKPQKIKIIQKNMKVKSVKTSKKKGKRK